MTNGEAVNWIINISADIGKAEHRDLWHYEQALTEIREMLEQLPSAQSEKAKRGFWYTIKKGDKGYSAGDFRCSVCNEPNHTWIPKPNFCPNCGADMRGTGDNSDE